MAPVSMGGSKPRVSPLWIRVDQNRTKLAAFVVFFVAGSALLLDLALIGVPGSLLSILATNNDVSAATWFEGLAVVLAATFGLLLAVGALIAAVQLANAEDWVRGRFSGRDLAPGEEQTLRSAVEDMALAAGMNEPPRLIVLEAAQDSVNALALGTTRSQPVIGVTPGFREMLSVDEQRAVIAALTARIVAGDIMFATALAALMGPLKAIRESRKAGADAAGSVAAAGCADPGCADGCGDGCVSGLDDMEGCGGAIVVVGFLVLVAVITYASVVTAAWIVTLWGRALHRTTYEKADAEGMLLLKDPSPMLSALSKASRSSNAVGDGDMSYDGIFYAATSGTPRVERVERRRYERLREVLGTEGLAAQPLE